MGSRAQELAKTISESWTILQDFLQTNNLGDLSIDQDIPIQYQFRPEFIAPKDAAVVACRELLALLQGSFGVLTAQTVCAQLQLRCIILTNKKAPEFANIQAVCRFEIASSFPEGRDTATYDELAEKSHLPEPEI